MWSDLIQVGAQKHYFLFPSQAFFRISLLGISVLKTEHRTQHRCLGTGVSGVKALPEPVFCTCWSLCPDFSSHVCPLSPPLRPPCGVVTLYVINPFLGLI